MGCRYELQTHILELKQFSSHLYSSLEHITCIESISTATSAVHNRGVVQYSMVRNNKMAVVSIKNENTVVIGKVSDNNVYSPNGDSGQASEIR